MPNNVTPWGEKPSPEPKGSPEPQPVVIPPKVICPKCKGAGKVPFKDSRGFSAKAYCECVGGGPVKG